MQEAMNANERVDQALAFLESHAREVATCTLAREQELRTAYLALPFCRPAGGPGPKGYGLIASRAFTRWVGQARAQEAKARAGCVSLRRCRTTGTIVGLYRSKEAGLESEEGCGWTAVCEDHGTLVSGSSRAALAGISSLEFCDECREAQAQREAIVEAAGTGR